MGQLALKLQAVKGGGLKEIQPPGPPRTTRVRPGFDSCTVTSSSQVFQLVTLQPVDLQILTVLTSFERSQPP